MSDKTSINIEISDKVKKTTQPKTIKRYDSVEKINKDINKIPPVKNKQFTYHPGMSNYNIKGDFNV